MDRPRLDNDIIIAYDDDYFGVIYEHLRCNEWEYFYYSEDEECHILREIKTRHTHYLKNLKWWAYFDDVCKKYEENA